MFSRPLSRTARMITTVPPIRGWRLFGSISAVVLSMSMLIFLVTPAPVDGLQSIIRATARTSFALFLAAFVASSLATLVPNDFTRGLVRERRYIGLSFAFSHLVHLVAIVAYGELNPALWPSRGVVANTPGTVGYVFILLMTLTSFRFAARHLSAAAWKRLHTTGMWVIAAVFAASFLVRVQMGALYAVFLSILCAAIAVRLVGKWAQANKRKQARTRGFPPEREALPSSA